MLRLVKSVLTTTVAFETIGMALSFLSFRRQFPFWKAVGVSAFHAVSAFNNCGFDLIGGFRGLTDYRGDVLLNVTTCTLIICGGLGFYVIHEIAEKRSFRACSLHTKIVLTMTAALLLLGTLLLRSTERITWLGAFFHSTSARTAGFATYPLGTFTNAGLLALIVLMFIGASPGSTGGGIKTTTFYVLLHAVYASATNQKSSAFHRNIPRDVIHKAFVIAFLAVCLVTASTFALCVLEKDKTLLQLLFEVVSAFGTVGLSTGITPDLLPASKAVLVLTMYIGRLGPLTAASLWLFKPDSVVSYPEESVTIG